MNAIWNENYDVNEILEAIGWLRKSYKKGAVEFKDGYLLEEYITVLLTIINFSNDLPETDKYQIVKESVYKVAENSKITPKILATEIRIRENKYFKTETKYTLITSMSVKNIPLPCISRISGSTIKFHSNLPARYRSSREKFEEKIKEYVKGEIPRDYYHVSVTVKGYSFHDAAEKAINILD